MTELAFPVAAKLSPLIARLASDSEPEVLACVRTIRRLLDARGLDLNDLAAAIEPRPAQVVYIEAEQREPRTWRDLANWIVRHDGGRLPPHERAFSQASMARRLVLRGEPSEKQGAWLRRLYARLGGQPPMVMIDPAIIGSVARKLFGEPTRTLSKPKRAALRHQRLPLGRSRQGPLLRFRGLGGWRHPRAGPNGSAGADQGRRDAAGSRNEGWVDRDQQASPEARKTIEGPDRGGLRYGDAIGAHAYDVVRLRNPKNFRQRAPDGPWSTKGIPGALPPPELLVAAKGALLFLVEGEKDVDRLRAAGLLATTSPQGAANWRDGYADSLKHRRVAIVPDNDDDGENYAGDALASLTRRGIPAAILRLEGLPHKGDVSDWLDAGGTAEQLVEMAQALLQPSCDLKPTPFQWIDPASIPPRPWLYGHHLIRGQISVTVAAAQRRSRAWSSRGRSRWSRGASSLGTGWQTSCASGSSTSRTRATSSTGASWPPASPRAGRRRLGDRLFRDSGRVRGLCTAVQVRDGVMILRPEMDALEAALARRRVDVLSVDPFVSSHQVSENDNVAIDLVAKEWARLAERCNCAIELVHHTRKLNGEEASSETAEAQSRCSPPRGPVACSTV